MGCERVDWMNVYSEALCSRSASNTPSMCAM
jgi:hypothetical protein